MRLLRISIVNDPEEGLDEFRQDGSSDSTIEITGREARRGAESNPFAAFGDKKKPRRTTAGVEDRAR
jgi:hypothetical protein